MSSEEANAARRVLDKRSAAEHAVDFVRSGMAVGLGAGTTARFALQKIAERLDRRELRDILGVPCSGATEGEARRLGIPLAKRDDLPRIDVTIDGADEVDRELNLIKGGGGALLTEKIVAQASTREIIVVDSSKLSPTLGTRHALPVEVVAFGWRDQLRYLEALGARVELRRHADGTPFGTDHGNMILDCTFGPIVRCEALAVQLQARAGIVGHGLFIGLATDVIVAGDGEIRHLTRERSKDSP